jgi:hypothetical protein
MSRSAWRRWHKPSIPRIDKHRSFLDPDHADSAEATPRLPDHVEFLEFEAVDGGEKLKKMCIGVKKAHDRANPRGMG